MSPLPPLLLKGDCIEEMRRIPDNSVDAVVTDPPYGIGFMGHAWDTPESAHGGFRRRGRGKDTGAHREGADGAGAMDAGRYDLSLTANRAFQVWVEAWADECFRILKPGGHMLAFGGARTWHRLAAGIEDAGFEIRDSIAWLFGSGMPKSHDVSKAIDKLDAAALRLERARTFQAWLRQYLSPKTINAATGTEMGHHLTTHPTQPAIATAPIFDLLRPLLLEVPAEIEALVAERTVESENYAKRGSTGKHASRAGVSEWRERYSGGAVAEASEKRDVPHTEAAIAWQGWGTALKPAFEPVVVARKPLPYRVTVAANVVEYGTGALNIDAARIPHADAADLATSLSKNPGRDELITSDVYGSGRAQQRVNTSGRWPTNVIIDEDVAADLADVARYFYVAKASQAERPKVDGVAHPTVKPLAIMRYLLRLIVAPGGVVVDPFAGSGTTLEAAYLEGFEAIGCEMTPEYWPLIAARIERVTA